LELLSRAVAVFDDAARGNSPATEHGLWDSTGWYSWIRHRLGAAAQQHIRPHGYMLPSPVLSYRLAVLDNNPSLPQRCPRIYHRMENRRNLI
jgi:hypothetical protein